MRLGGVVRAGGRLPRPWATVSTTDPTGHPIFRSRDPHRTGWWVLLFVVRRLSAPGARLARTGHHGPLLRLDERKPRAHRDRRHTRGKSFVSDGDQYRIMARRRELRKATHAPRSGATGAVVRAAGCVGEAPGKPRVAYEQGALWRLGKPVLPCIQNSQQRGRFHSGTAQSPAPA
jgi:hypothetical protein